MVLSACGIRVSDARLTAAGSLGNQRLTTTVTSPTGSTGSGVGPLGSGGGTLVPGTTTGPQVSGPGAPLPGTTSGGSTTTKGSTSGAVGASGEAPCTSSGAPIALGQTGAFSGFLGPSIGGSRNGLAAWAAEVNARGGIQCHPVQLYQLDDGSNPAKTSSNVQDLVQNKHVVAMVGPDVPITIAAYRSAIDPTGIPTVGGDLITPDWNTDPLLYPQGTAAYPGYAGAIRATAAFAKTSKFGLLYCVEASICSGIHDRISYFEQKAGVKFVSQQSISLTQTDFTSECQNAKNAGAQSLFLAMDGSAMTRLFRSCAAIGYRPPSGTTGIAIAPNSGSDPNVQEATITLNQPVASFSNTNILGVQHFLAAMNQYAPNAPVDNPAVDGYAAGKLFEAALKQVAAKARGGAVTSAMIIEGLNKLRGETLEGLAPSPISFFTGKPHTPIECYFTVFISKKGFTDPNNGKPSCL